MKIDTTKYFDSEIVGDILKNTELNDKIVYHYTSVDALFGGIIVKDEPQPGKEICLWATNCCYMNDPEELNTGVRLAYEVLNIPSDESTQAIREQVKDSMYIISFSSAIDCLPMWGMYGKNGHGLALGFDTTVLKTTLGLSKCVYANDFNKERLKGEILKRTDLPQDWWKHLNGEDILSKLLENVLDMSWVYILLWILGKNPAYEYEQEVRRFFLAEDDIKYRLKDNLIAPYVEQYLPKSALKEIWIGPTNDMNRAAQSLKMYLNHKGFNEVEIKQSKVPYRD